MVDAGHRFPARHDKSGNPHQIGKTGVDGSGDKHHALVGHDRLLRARTVFEPVISCTQSRKDDRACNGLEPAGGPDHEALLTMGSGSNRRINFMASRSSNRVPAPDPARRRPTFVKVHYQTSAVASVNLRKQSAAAGIPV